MLAELQERLVVISKRPRGCVQVSPNRPDSKNHSILVGETSMKQDIILPNNIAIK